LKIKRYKNIKSADIQYNKTEEYCHIIAVHFVGFFYLYKHDFILRQSTNEEVLLSDDNKSFLFANGTFYLHQLQPIERITTERNFFHLRLHCHFTCKETN